MNPIHLIAKKRDRFAHNAEELQFIAQGASDGSIPDYQLSAWLMAVYLNGLSLRETVDLTMAMANTGTQVDLTGVPRPWVDKHSTGGVGDKTTLIVLPILASCGLTMVKMSGRGLGVTGGTVDKLESVPGFRMDLNPAELKEQAERIGIAITGQSPDLAPGDKALYALRDVTGTTESIPLIASSVLSKKIAGGAEVVVLDVKCGSGAFMKDRERAIQLAGALKQVAVECGLRVAVAVTDMSQPLGRCVGNALEVRESLETLSGGGDARLRALCTFVAGLALFESGQVNSVVAAVNRAEQALDDGSALRTAHQWFIAQGADPRVFSDATILPQANIVRVVEHRGRTGYVQTFDAAAVGYTVVNLGGGRRQKGDEIDPSVGIEIHAPVGSRVEQGAPLFSIHAASEADADYAERALRAACVVESNRIDPPDLVMATY